MPKKEEQFICVDCGEPIDLERVKALTSLNLVVETCSVCQEKRETEAAQWAFVAHGPKWRPIRLVRKKPIYY